MGKSNLVKLRENKDCMRHTISLSPQIRWWRKGESFRSQAKRPRCFVCKGYMYASTTYQNRAGIDLCQLNSQLWIFYVSAQPIRLCVIGTKLTRIKMPVPSSSTSTSTSCRSSLQDSGTNCLQKNTRIEFVASPPVFLRQHSAVLSNLSSWIPTHTHHNENRSSTKIGLLHDGFVQNGSNSILIKNWARVEVVLWGPEWRGSCDYWC